MKGTKNIMMVFFPHGYHGINQKNITKPKKLWIFRPTLYEIPFDQKNQLQSIFSSYLYLTLI